MSEDLDRLIEEREMKKYQSDPVGDFFGCLGSVFLLFTVIPLVIAGFYFALKAFYVWFTSW